MNRTLQSFLPGLATAFLLTACGSGEESANGAGQPASAPAANTPYTTLATADIAPGLHAQITGHLQAQLQGSGVYRIIRPRQQRAGYHYLGDGSSHEDITLTLIFPANAHSGVFPLSSTPPADTGKTYEARLESNSAGSFSYNTDGVLTLNQMQVADNGHILASGTFEFSSANESGQRVNVNGGFNFDLNNATTSVDTD